MKIYSQGAEEVEEPDPDHLAALVEGLVRSGGRDAQDGLVLGRIAAAGPAAAPTRGGGTSTHCGELRSGEGLPGIVGGGSGAGGAGVGARGGGRGDAGLRVAALGPVGGGRGGRAWTSWARTGTRLDVRHDQPTRPDLTYPIYRSTAYSPALLQLGTGG